MVEAAHDEGIERLFTRVSARAVTAVVAEGNRVGERHVQTNRARDSRRHLGHFERVCEPGAHVVVGEHEDLGLAGQSAKGARVQDSVAVSFEARTKLIGLFFDYPMSGALPTGRAHREDPVKLLFTLMQRSQYVSTVGARDVNGRDRVLVGHGHVARGTLKTLHRGGPAPVVL